MKFLIKLIIILLLNSLYFAQQEAQDITSISLDSLLNVKVNTVSKYLQTSNEAPASVSIITADDIEKFGFITLEEALSPVRGFYISNDRNYSYLGVRGFGRPTDYNNRILLLINGRTINENVYGSAYIESCLGVNLESVERIEIVRGPGSVLYGTGAMFAVINIITKDGFNSEGLKFSTLYGSYQRKQGQFTFGDRINDFNFFVSGIFGDIKGQDLYFEEFNNPENNNGIAKELDWEKYYGFFTKINYKDFSLQGRITSREKGIPTGAYETVFNDKNTRSLDAYNFIELKYEKQIDHDKNFFIKGYYQHYHYRGTYPYDELQFDATDNNWVGAEGQFRWDFLLNNRFIIGTEYRKQLRADYRLWDSHEIYFNGDFPSHCLSFYINDEYDLFSNFTITLGLRKDGHITPVNSSSYVVPRLALVYEPFSKSTIKFLYGEAFRLPNVYEAFYEDPLLQKSNPDIKPENIKSTEFVVEQRIGNNIIGTFSLYSNKITDLIDLQLDEIDSLLQFHNVSKVTSNGIETEMKFFPYSNFHGFFNYTYQKTFYSDTKLQLTNSPQHLLKLGFVIPVKQYFTTAIELYYETSRITVKDTETKPFFLGNINFSSVRFLKYFSASFKVNNIFNQNYELPAGYEHVQSAIRQNGRNFLLKLNCEL